MVTVRRNYCSHFVIYICLNINVCVNTKFNYRNLGGSLCPYTTFAVSMWDVKAWITAYDPAASYISLARNEDYEFKKLSKVY